MLLLFVVSSIIGHREIEKEQGFDSFSILSLRTNFKNATSRNEQDSISTSSNSLENQLLLSSPISSNSTVGSSLSSHLEETSTHIPTNQTLVSTSTANHPSVLSEYNNSTHTIPNHSNDTLLSTVSKSTSSPSPIVSTFLPVSTLNSTGIQKDGNGELSTISTFNETIHTHPNTTNHSTYQQTHPNTTNHSTYQQTQPNTTNHSTYQQTQPPQPSRHYKLVLFTTGEHYSPHILQKAKIIKNWYSILQQDQSIHTVVFTKSPAFIELFNGTSTVITSYLVNKFNFPIVTNMFDVIRHSFDADYYGYVNFDILIENNIIPALNYLSYLVSQHYLSPKHELVGRVAPIDINIIPENLSSSQFGRMYNSWNIRNPSSSVSFHFFFKSLSHYFLYVIFNI